MVCATNQTRDRRPKSLLFSETLAFETAMSTKIQLTARHVMGARGLLKMSQDDLASASGVNARTIRDFENGNHQLRDKNLEAIREAFELRGVEFTNGDNPGVRLVADKAVIPLT